MSLNEDKLDEYSEELDKNGIVVIPGYMDEEKCDELRSNIMEKIESDDLEESEEGMGYSDLAGFGEPIIDRRSGERDDGMLDIFNLEMEIDRLADIKEDESIAEIVNKASDWSFSVESFNIYYNKSVDNTRGFHADTYGGKYKAFVYLTDVPSASYGAHAYIPGSHKPSFLHQKGRLLLNRLRGKPATNAVFSGESDAKIVTGQRGTLIITNQAGLHRGMPQGDGKERMAVNTQYTPDE